MTTRWGRSAKLVCLTAASMALGACYNRPYHDVTSVYPTLQAKARLAIIEVDDRGNFWNGVQADTALRLVRTAVASGPTALVLFIHGWGHNAKPGDQNMVCFANSLDYLGDVVNREGVGKQLAALAKVAPAPGTFGVQAVERPVNIVGIYIGWRGKSLPELPGFLSLLTRVPTFWGRKGSAERAGGGNVHDFIETLGQFYDSVHARPRGPAGYFSFVSVAQSFGGQVLLPAASRRIERQLIEASGDRAWYALRGEGPIDPNRKTIRGLGDLVVLVNPATESEGFEPLHRLSKRLTYAPSQTPVLTVISAVNDRPNQLAFPIGQYLGTLFEPITDEEQRRRDYVGLGRYTPQQTHWLDWRPSSSKSGATDTARPAEASRSPLDGNTRDCRYGPPPTGVVVDSLAEAVRASISAGLDTVDLSGSWMINGKRLSRSRPDSQAYASLMVVRSRATQVIDGHNGFYKPEFVDFLTRYISSIQLKRFGQEASLFQAGKR